MIKRDEELHAADPFVTEAGLDRCRPGIGYQDAAALFWREKLRPSGNIQNPTDPIFGYYNIESTLYAMTSEAFFDRAEHPTAFPFAGTMCSLPDG